MVRAWFMNDSGEDQRLPHHKEPKEFVELDALKKIGVDYWKIDPQSYETNEEFANIKRERSYSYQDLITVSSETLPNYESKIKAFFEEHIHTDEEIRFVLDGSGYFDVRNTDDLWIRIEVTKGDMIVLPAGIYHRFTLDSNNYIKALRLFVGEPVWTPINRTDINELHKVRQQYKENFVNNQIKAN